MTWLDFVVLTLAASAVVDAWFNGSLFAEWRAFISDIFDERTPDDAVIAPIAPQDSQAAPQSSQNMPWLMRLADSYMPDFVAEILSCLFCFSYHAPWIVGVVFFFTAYLSPWGWLAFLLKLPAYSLAATRLGNILNACVPPKAKYDQ